MTPVVELLAMAAAAAPEKVALAGTEITYRTLDARAAAIACALVERGVSRGHRVVVWLPKSPAYVISIFAIMRAWAAYVPLDASQPAARVTTILHDAEPTALITTKERLESLPDLPSTLRAVWVVDSIEPDAAAALVPRLSFDEAVAGPTALRPLPITLADMAAILYTSGSTGTPKGVTISHLNLANFIDWALHEMDLRPDDVFSGHASFNFDLSTFDLFAAVGARASLWLVPDEHTRNVAALARGIPQHGITVWYSVPSVLVLMLEAGVLTRESLASIRYLVFAGEVFPIKHLRRLRDLLPAGARLYNLYGPTETNVCTFYRADAIDPERRSPLPIGRPISGARVSIVDDEGRAVSDGAIGELIVEGACVTPGYFRRPGDPNADNHAQHRHATGDLVSYEGDDLVYRGRKDRMLKIQGFRVELGEIEAALLRHPSIREAAVLAVSEDTGIGLLAFCSFTDPAPPTLVQIKRHCSTFVPRYMIPRGVVRLDSLPKNANGKVDYRQLGELAPASHTHRNEAMP